MIVVWWEKFYNKYYSPAPGEAGRKGGIGIDGKKEKYGGDGDL